MIDPSIDKKNMINRDDDKDEYEVRLKRMKEIIAMGIYPYSSRFEKTHSIDKILDAPESQNPRESKDVFKVPKGVFKTAGRIITKRIHGKISFFNIQDNTGILQICFKEDVIGKEKYKFIVSLVDVGDFIGIEGEPFLTEQKKLAILSINYEFLTKTLRPLPAKFHGLENIEKKYRQRYLDLIANRETFNRFVLRSNLVQSIREWLLRDKFIELTTRILQSQAGGAMAKSFVTHHNSLNHDFNLRISPELDLKMSIVGGFERVFEFAVNFRNEGIDSNHLQEFQMLEWYCAYEDYIQGMNRTEKMLKENIKKVLGRTTFFVLDKNDRKHEVNMEEKFHRISFSEILSDYDIDIFASKEELLKISDKYGLSRDESKKRSRGNLLDDIYKKVIRPNIIQPTFITNYPADLLPLARPSDADPRLADSYQLIIGASEVVKGYSELVDPVLQRTAFEKQTQARLEGDEEAMIKNNEYLLAMEHGMPPITGCGIGIDRLITLITEQKNLKDNVLFPLMRPDENEA